MRRLLGYVRYDSEAAREAINDLYRHELRWFQNFFLPSVKLAKKERVGSRLWRRYAAPQTPLQRLAACGAADPVRVAEVQRLRQSLDPFQLSVAVEAKRMRIFTLSRETALSMAQRSQESPPVGTAPDTPAVVRPAPGQPEDSARSSSGWRKKRPARRCGNDAPRKAGKTPRIKASFPRFPPRLEIRPKPKTPDSHIPTATAAGKV